MKTCTSCLSEKPIDSFYKKKRGHSSHCKECIQAKYRVSYVRKKWFKKDEVLEILKSTDKQINIARKFGVHRVTIAKIQKGQRWTEIFNEHYGIKQ